LFVKSRVRRVIENLPYSDEILEYDDRGRDPGLVGILSWAMRLRRRRIDLAVILPNSFSSALMVFLAGIKRRVGYSREARGLLLTDPIEPPREGSKIVPLPMVEYYLRISDSLECPRVSTTPELSVSSAARENVRTLFQEHGINEEGLIVVMIPGAAYGLSKCWEPAYFATVADHLIERYGCDLLIVPGPGEVEIARGIQTKMQRKPFLLANPVIPLDTLMALIESCSLVITNDTGPRHFAVAFDKPVVVIMGPTDPRYTNSNLEKTIVLRKDIDCSPCHLKVCPSDHRCMTEITPDRVIRASETLLDRFTKTGDESEMTEKKLKNRGGGLGFESKRSHEKSHREGPTSRSRGD
jgi:heptosyltransferase-2